MDDTPSRDHGDAALNDIQRHIDARRASLALDGHSAGTLAAALVAALSDSPLVDTEPFLHDCVIALHRGDDPVRVVMNTLLAYAADRTRLLKIATDAALMAPLGPIAVSVDSFRAPAHNPGARVIPTGGER